jgi:hypothetical protein
MQMPRIEIKSNSRLYDVLSDNEKKTVDQYLLTIKPSESVLATAKRYFDHFRSKGYAPGEITVSYTRTLEKYADDRLHFDDEISVSAPYLSPDRSCTSRREALIDSYYTKPENSKGAAIRRMFQAARERLIEEMKPDVSVKSAEFDKDLVDWVSEHGSERVKLALKHDLPYEHLAVKEWIEWAFDTEGVFMDTDDKMSERCPNKTPELRHLQTFDARLEKAENVHLGGGSIEVNLVITSGRGYYPGLSISYHLTDGAGGGYWGYELLDGEYPDDGDD